MLQQLKLEILSRVGSSSVERRGTDDDGAGKRKRDASVELPFFFPTPRPESMNRRVDSLRVLSSSTSNSPRVLRDVVVDESSSIGALDERSLLSVQSSVSSSCRRINESDDLQTCTELVLESERVVPGS